MRKPREQDPIGVFDSGVGGLSVWREIKRQLPHENTLFFADQEHVPYGPRSQEEIQHFSIHITQFLLDQGAKIIIIACNTASAAALHPLRARYPDVDIVGMEPALKPASENTQNGAVGVIATPTTLLGELFQSLTERFGQDVQLHTQACPGLVNAVENGNIDNPQTEALLRTYLEPMLAANIDQLVLGCTHYPFLSTVIRRITGPGVTQVDPAPAVARHIGHLLRDKGIHNSASQPGNDLLYTSGDPQRFAAIANTLVAYSGPVQRATWEEVGLKPEPRLLS